MAEPTTRAPSGRIWYRALALLILVAAGLYMTPFVDRGWIPHDEGQLGQAAERALHGELPHLDFDEAYTGGLTWLNAAVFHAFGVRLVWLRWALFAGAIGGILCFHGLLRRFGGPVTAAGGALLAATWAFPNYFVALPSWWNLILAAGSLLALFKAFESERLRYVLVAGVLTGLSLALKQTALYVVVGGVLSLVYATQTRAARRAEGLDFGGAFWMWSVAPLAALAFALFVVRDRVNAGTVLFFVLPIGAVCGLMMAEAARCALPPLRRTAQAAATFAVGAAIPLAFVVAPYLWRGALGDFLHGWLIAPQARMAHAALDPQSPALLVLGLPVIAAAVGAAAARRRLRPWLLGAMSLLAVLSPLAYASDSVYQAIWQSARLAGFAPAIAVGILWHGIEPDPVRRAQLFAVSAVMAFWSLVQYPFSATIYFCYVVPLAPVVLLGVARAAGRPWMQALAPLALLYLLFAIFSMNWSDPGKIGVLHHRAGQLVPLGLERAGLRVPPGDAATYRRVIELVEQHRWTSAIYAAPDCPEVYFLSGSENPTRAFYDVLTTGVAPALDELLHPERVSVVVLNRYPHFSAPPDEALDSLLRQRYASSESVGKFEVFWTDAPR